VSCRRWRPAVSRIATASRPSQQERAQIPSRAGKASLDLLLLTRRRIEAELQRSPRGSPRAGVGVRPAKAGLTVRDVLARAAERKR
jgi:hypothetical protein